MDAASDDWHTTKSAVDLVKVAPSHRGRSKRRKRGIRL